MWFLFCMIWSVCAGMDEAGRKKMDTFVREMEGQFPAKVSCNCRKWQWCVVCDMVGSMMVKAEWLLLVLVWKFMHVHSGHCVWVLCWCEDQELDALGRETQGNMEIPQQVSPLSFVPLALSLIPHQHPCACTHVVPPSTRFWYQQWTHCAMTSWYTTSSWLRDLSCWLDRLGQAKPQWPRGCCRSWILRHSTYSPLTFLHRFTVYLFYVTVCVYVHMYVYVLGQVARTHSWQERLKNLSRTLTAKVIRICKYCTYDI